MQILYATNTFNLTSPLTIRSFSNLFSSDFNWNIRSLELVWNTRKLPLSEGFGGRQAGVLFPLLEILHVTFAGIQDNAMLAEHNRWEVDYATNCRINEQRTEHLRNAFLNHTLPQFEEDLINRILPARTEVTLTLRKREWFMAIDLALVGSQGVEASRPQRTEDGIRFWKVMTRRASSTQAQNGYWVRLPLSDCNVFSQQFGTDAQTSHTVTPTEGKSQSLN